MSTEPELAEDLYKWGDDKSLVKSEIPFTTFSAVAQINQIIFHEYIAPPDIMKGYFIGPLPKVGDVVEWVVGKTDFESNPNVMHLFLRVKS